MVLLYQQNHFVKNRTAKIYFSAAIKNLVAIKKKTKKKRTFGCSSETFSYQQNIIFVPNYFNVRKSFSSVILFG